MKYVVLAPWVAHSIYSYATKGESERDLTNLLILPLLLWRMLHDQIWISISRHRTANGKNRIVDKTIEFEQVDRESNWSVLLLLNYYLNLFWSPNYKYLCFFHSLLRSKREEKIYGEIWFQETTSFFLMVRKKLFSIRWNPLCHYSVSNLVPISLITW
mgnify:CR=1 FL=1